MKKYSFGTLLLISVLLISILSACGLVDNTDQTEDILRETPGISPTVAQINEPEITYPHAEMEFIAKVPGNTPPDQHIYIGILDEVTGLALNAQLHEMQLDEGISDPINRYYKITLAFPVGSTIKYRYTRQDNSVVVAEHYSNGEPVRYRLVQVDGPGSISDIISRWTDTDFVGNVGRIVGRAINGNDDSPIHGLLIAVGGTQTRTNEDGAFQVDGLPVGVHNLVGYSTDGKFDTFHQGAEIAENLPTLTPIELTPRDHVKVQFMVKLPEDTPPVVPVRLAGSLEQLGNTFTALSGGFSLSTDLMPAMQLQPNGLYMHTLELYEGADLHYKYTLGDGFWNAEHSSDGEFRVRQLIVPGQDTTITDIVDTWFSSGERTITFDVTVPENTPASDFVSIQFNPILGWTEPLPMWSLGDNRWAYVLFSPLNLPGNFHYRYCRNNQCGVLDDIETPGDYGPGRLIDMNSIPIILTDQVDAWTDLGNQ